MHSFHQQDIHDYDERKKHEKNRKKKGTQEILFLNLEVDEYKMKREYIQNMNHKNGNNRKVAWSAWSARLKTQLNQLGQPDMASSTNSDRNTTHPTRHNQLGHLIILRALLKLNMYI